MSLFGRPKTVRVPPPPPPVDASKTVKKKLKDERKSVERFAQRQQALGPMQLQAPGIRV